MIENPEAERALLACAILGNYGRDVLQRLDATDFTDTRHRVIAGGINEMVARNLPVDQLTLTEWLSSKGQLSTPGGAGGRMFVVDIAVNFTGVPQNADYYAEHIRTATRIRNARFAAVDLVAATENEAVAGELDTVLNLHRERIEGIPGPIAVDDDNISDKLGVILSEDDEPTEWVIPGWLSREERAVVVAGEGIAKTTLMRQFAISIAGGLNPWSGQRVADGQRVLYIDTENSRNQSRRGYAWVAGRIVRPMIAPGWKDRITHKTRNDGLDLAGQDRMWFIDIAKRINPDVLIVGPAYKLMRGDPQKDRDVQDLLYVIDKVRVAQNCAVLIETHAPHGQAESRHMRPYGSSVWLRWPEVGVGYQRDLDERVEQQKARPDHLVRLDFRGQREERDWPDLIRFGDPRKREMPWTPTRDDWSPSVRTNYVIPEGEA